MARAAVRRSWRDRVWSLAGSLTLGVLVLALTSAGTAQDPEKKGSPKTEPTKKEAPRSESEKPEAPRSYPINRVTVVSKAPDVAETVKLINEKLAAGWVANKVVPSRPATDLEFLRRATLDIIGRVATPAEIQKYQADPDDKRRSLLIERLLNHEEYARHWAGMWGNWLLSRSGVFGRGTYHDELVVWLEDQFAQNKPYHQIVEQLLTATGSNKENGAVNFILAHVGETVPAARQGEEGQFEMVPITARVTRLFLGTQVQCAQCHDHPFVTSIKQNHFWGVNAFLRQVRREGTPPLERARNMMTFPTLTLKDNRSVNADATLFYEKRNGVVLQTRAEFLPSGEAKHGPKLSSPDGSGLPDNFRRRELAAFLIEHENFPRAVVNRMWGVFLGRGFVNPVDDFNEQNPPSNPELLNELATRFKHYNYDLKKLIRWICHSDAYNLSYMANPTNEKPEKEVLFSRMLLKSMSPEQLFESLMVATQAEAGETKEGRNQLRDRWLNNLISNFGDDEGNEVNFNGTVVQALLMMNGKEINDALGNTTKGTLAYAMAKHRSPAGVVNSLYLATLNRPPSDVELRLILSRLGRPGLLAKDAKDPAARYQDVFWALLNSNEFLLNH